MAIVKTQVEVAKHFGVSEENVRKWRKKEPPMPGERGAWDLEEIAAWIELNVDSKKRTLDAKKKAAGASGGNGSPANGAAATVSKRQELETRKLEAETISREVKSAQELLMIRVQFESLADINDINRFIERFLTWLRDQHLKMVAEMVGGYSGEVAEAIREDLSSRLDLIFKAGRRKLDDLDELRLEPKDVKKITQETQESPPEEVKE